MRGIRRNLLHKQFGRWFVVAPAENNGNKTMWLCRCACGTERKVFTENLMNGLTQSCGCGGRRRG